MEFFDNYGIEPLRLLGQVLVWVILYLILKKYAFTPILNVLEERKNRIAESVANAERIQRELEEAERTRKQLIAQAQATATELINEAKKAADATGAKRIQEAAEQAEAILRKAEETAALERERILNQLRAEIGNLVVATTAKVAGKVLTPADQTRLRDEAASSLRN
ncbi:MAG: F0F1 ATP synthase subunit B [Verrucomicrobiia bacterium]